MAHPTGVITRPLTAGGSIEVESGDELVMAGRIVASHGLIWTATGERMPTLGGDVLRVPAGEQLVFTPPVTDQSGYRDLATGYLIDVSPEGSHTHTYTLTVWYERDGRQVGPIRTWEGVVLPTDDLSPVDADTLITADTVPGLLVSVPDSWSAQVAQAVAAAGSSTAAAASAGDAAQSAIAAGLARDGAVTARTGAETAQGLAEDARDAAQSANATTVATGTVVGDDLILTRTDTTTVNAGNVRGGQGVPGPPNSLAIGTVTTLAAGASATAAITGEAPNQSLALGVPMGLTGAASDWLKVGPGDPRTPSTTSGQITGTEPNGCSYRSTDGGGVGGYLWTKRAGVWICETGDTGVCNIAALLANGWTVSAGGYATIQRINQMIFLRLRLSAAAATAGWCLNLPTGWKFQANRLQWAIGSNGSTVREGFISAGSYINIGFYSAADTLVALSAIPAPLTQDPWPTSLIGT